MGAHIVISTFVSYIKLQQIRAETSKKFLLLPPRKMGRSIYLKTEIMLCIMLNATGYGPLR